jgi:hypothetical protein
MNPHWRALIDNMTNPDLISGGDRFYIASSMLQKRGSP